MPIQCNHGKTIRYSDNYSDGWGVAPRNCLGTTESGYNFPIRSRHQGPNGSSDSDGASFYDKNFFDSYDAER